VWPVVMMCEVEWLCGGSALDVDGLSSCVEYNVAVAILWK